MYFSDPGLELVITDRSPLWEAFTDMVFEKNGGVWTRNNTLALPNDAMIVRIGESTATYQFSTTRIDANYRNETMSIKANFWCRNEERDWH